MVKIIILGVVLWALAGMAFLMLTGCATYQPPGAGIWTAVAQERPQR
jgi:hypothetical protein